MYEEVFVLIAITLSLLSAVRVGTQGVSFRHNLGCCLGESTCCRSVSESVPLTVILVCQVWHV